MVENTRGMTSLPNPSCIRAGCLHSSYIDSKLATRVCVLERCCACWGYFYGVLDCKAVNAVIGTQFTFI